MNGFRKIFPIFLSHYATLFAKMAERRVVPLDELHHQSKPMHSLQKHPVFIIFIIQGISRMIITPTELKMQPTIHLQS
jgi:Leu/Phe-tRNA-protein transferase